jgi:hypothetical protein
MRNGCWKFESEKIDLGQKKKDIWVGKKQIVRKKDIWVVKTYLGEKR